MPQEIPEALPVLPEPPPEFSPPLFARIKPLHVLVVQVVETLPGRDSAWHKHEVEAVHLLPVVFHGPLLLDAGPHGGAREGSELRHVHVVEPQGHDEIARRADRFLGFARKPHHEQSLCAQACLFDARHRVPHLVESNARLMPLEHPRVRRLNPQGDHQAPCVL